MPKTTRQRADAAADAEQATVDQILSLQDSCALFDAGRDHQFNNMAVQLRALCHDGSSQSLLNSIREKGRDLPSSVRRTLINVSTGASDHFSVVQTQEQSMILPRLDLRRSDMKTKKFKLWWTEIVITDEWRRGLSRGGIVLAVANNEGGAHFTHQVDELYDDLARRNGLGLLWATDGRSWRTYGLAPIRATVRQIAHEFLLGMEDWIASRRPDWSYAPVVPEISGFQIMPGIEVETVPVWTAP